MLNITSQEIAWLAGLLEGEGWFGIGRGSHGSNGITPSLTLRMTDHDVVERARKLCGLIPETKVELCKSRPHNKPAWSLQARGQRAIGIMLTVWSFMGERRKRQIRAAIERWKSSPQRPRAIAGEVLIPSCHPDRTYRARGFCSACYQHSQKIRQKGRQTNAEHLYRV